MDTQIVLESLLSQEKKIKQEIAVLNETLTALQVVIKFYNSQSTTDINLNEIEGFKIYGDDNQINPLYYGREPETHTERVYSVLDLREGKKGKAKEIAEDLFNYFPNIFSEKRAFEVATLELSILKKEGKIFGEKILGKNSYIYSIKNESDEY